jgi:predicted HTH transcriptional regulator
MKHISQCQLCGGSGTYRLPLLMETLPVYIPVHVEEPTATIQMQLVQCPVCHPGAVQDQINILGVSQILELTGIREADVDRRQHVMKSVGRSLGEHMVEKGFVKFREAPVYHSPHASTRIIAEVGVVSAEVRDTIEARQNEKSLEDVERAMDHLVAEVNHWGSHYGRTDIEKRRVGQIAGEIVQKLRHEMAQMQKARLR